MERPTANKMNLGRAEAGDMPVLGPREILAAAPLDGASLCRLLGPIFVCRCSLSGLFVSPCGSTLYFPACLFQDETRTYVTRRVFDQITPCYLARIRQYNHNDPIIWALFISSTWICFIYMGSNQANHYLDNLLTSALS